MKEKPILSIIIPVYNSEDYLEECLESIVSNDLNQIEILLINDGSNDHSAKIIENYSSQYQQITYYNRENSGVSSSRNFGLKKSQGKWVWFIDSDDIIQSQILKKVCKLLITTDLDVFLFQYIQFEDKVNQKIESPVYLNNVKKEISQYTAMKSLIDSKYATFPWNKIFKSSLFSDIVFPEDRSFTEDMAVLYKIYDKAKYFVMTSEPLYFYRQRSTSLVHTISVKNLEDSALSHYEMVTFFENKYPNLVPKLKYETIISIISYFHRISFDEIKKHHNLYNYLFKNKDYSLLNVRYKIELLTLKYCYPAFKFIGYVGILNRRGNKK